MNQTHLSKKSKKKNKIQAHQIYLHNTQTYSIKILNSTDNKQTEVDKKKEKKTNKQKFKDKTPNKGAIKNRSEIHQL